MEQSLHCCRSFNWIWGWYKKTSTLFAIHSDEVFHQFSSVCHHCQKRRRREFKIYCLGLRPALKKEWESSRSGDWIENFLAESSSIFFCVLRVLRKNKHEKQEPGLWKEKSGAQKWFLWVAKHNVVMPLNLTNTNLAAKAQRNAWGLWWWPFI